MAIAATAKAQNSGWTQWLPEGFRDSVVLDIEGWQWIALIALLLASFLLGLGVRFLLSSMFGLTKRIRSQEISVGSGRGTKRSIAFLTAGILWAVALPSLHLKENAHHVLEKAVILAVVAAFTWLAVSIWEVGCDLFAHHQTQVLSHRATHLVIPLIRRLGRFIVITIGGVFLVSSLGYDVSALLAGLGIGGIAVALAAKDSVENLFGSLTIVLDMPFAVGDWIRLDKVDGVVEEINLRSTRVRTLDDSLITLPNSNLIKASVENMGARRFRRFRTQILIPGQPSAAAVTAFLEKARAAMIATEGVRKEDASLTLNDFSDQGLRVQMTVHLEVDTLAEELNGRERVVMAILGAAQGAGISLGPTPMS